MQAGDLVFVRDKGIIPTLIRFFDPGRFNHVAVAVSDTQIIEAEYNTRVHIVDMNYEDIEIVSLGLTLEQQEAIVKAANKYIGRRYDLLQILGYLIKERIGSPKQLICSELAHDMLKDIKLKIGNRFTTPNQLYALAEQYLKAA
jgi:hypothetical protein